MSQSLICSRKIHDYSSFKALVDRSIATVTSEMLEGETIIGNSAFRSCASLTSVEIPNSVTSIDHYAFYGCTRLTNTEIPNSVAFIGGSAFQDCTRLTNIEIPNSVAFIGASAFQGCTSLTNIEIPDGITSIGNSAFQYCTSLTSFTVRATTPPTLGNSAFYGANTNLKIYVPSESVETYKSASGWSTYASKIQAIPEA